LLDPAHPHVSLGSGAHGDARGKKREDECGHDSLRNRSLCPHLVLPSRFMCLPSVRDTLRVTTSAVPTCNPFPHSTLQEADLAPLGGTGGKKSGTRGAISRAIRGRRGESPEWGRRKEPLLSIVATRR